MKYVIRKKTETLQKAKYIKRWKGKDGKWKYLYKQPEQKKKTTEEPKKLLAPNGKPSNLNARQWKQVRTPEFKEWFGDWEKDPENASKVVDENGEPKILYHGTNEIFQSFSKKKLGEKTQSASAKKAFFFTDNPDTAMAYLVETPTNMTDEEEIKYNKTAYEIQKKIEGETQKDGKIPGSDFQSNPEERNITFGKIDYNKLNKFIEKYDYRTSINKEMSQEEIKNILGKRAGIKVFGISPMKVLESYIEEIAIEYGNMVASSRIGKNPNILPVYMNIRNPEIDDFDGSGISEKRSISKLINKAIKSGKDGIFINNISDGGSISNHYASFEPNQIKSSMSNSGSFDPNSDNINKSMDGTMKYVIRKSIKGGKADHITKEDLAKKYDISIDELQKRIDIGIKVEMEHTDDKNIAEEIAMDHLSEFIDYYKGLKKMETKLEKSISDIHKKHIREFFQNAKKKVKDKDFHAFVEKMGINPHEAEEYVYELLAMKKSEKKYFVKSVSTKEGGKIYVTAKESERRTPPKGYPKSTADYLDPDNLKYPIDTEKHVRSAMSYFSKNKKDYPFLKRRKMWKKLVVAANKFGIEVSKDVQERAEKSVPESTYKHPDKLGYGAKKRKKLKSPEDKFEAVMGEFKRGTLRSGSGDIVTDKDQAIAIAYSESGMNKSVDMRKSVQELEYLSKKKGVPLAMLIKEAAMGVLVEFEHTDDKAMAFKIAMDHLKETPFYYSRLWEAGLADELEKLDEGDNLELVHADLEENEDEEIEDIEEPDEITEENEIGPWTDKYGELPLRISSKQEIVDFLSARGNQEIPDDEIHELADRLGEDTEAVESFIYSLAAQGLQKSIDESGDLKHWKKKILLLLKKIVDNGKELKKSKGYPVGTIREWGGTKYKKLPSNKWGPVADPKDTKRYNLAILNLGKKVKNASNEKELREIINENISRFQDDKGNVYKEVDDFFKVANKRFSLDNKSADIAEGRYAGKKLLIGGQYFKKLGSKRFTEDTDYVIFEPKSKEKFIHDTENGIDYVNAANIPIYKEVWEKEKNNNELSLESAFMLSAYTWRNHLLNFNFDKADDKEHDMGFLIDKMGKVPDMKMLKQYFSDGEYSELNKFVNKVKAGSVVQKSAKWDHRYKLQGKKKWNGLDISIENKKGSIRQGTDPDGKPWKVKMKYPYGRILGTEGFDGDHTDIMLGPDKKSERVFVVHQVNPWEGGAYDEDKCLIQFSTPEKAKKAYLSNYNRKDVFGDMTEFTVDEFKAALQKCKGRRLEKAMKEDKLEEYKKKLLEILERTDKPEEKTEKSIAVMCKAKGLPVGTIREWNGKKYKKGSNNKWMLYYEGESRGRSQAYHAIKRNIDNAKTMDELVEIVKNNKNRFMEDGKVSPVVASIINYAKGAKKYNAVKKSIYVIRK